MKKQGFTLVELLVVMTIIALLAGITVPLVANAYKSSKIRRAELEMQSIRTAVLQFQSDHRYMPWPYQGTTAKPIWVGADVATAVGTQTNVIGKLTGDNALKKVYLEVPEGSRNADDEFVDPWGVPYAIALDRDLSDTIEVKTAPFIDVITTKVAVASSGPNRDWKQKGVLKTW